MQISKWIGSGSRGQWVQQLTGQTSDRVIKWRRAMGTAVQAAIDYKGRVQPPYLLLLRGIIVILESRLDRSDV